MDSRHWDDIYQKKSEQEVSWFQAVPMQSLALIDEFNLNKNAPIIDIGGGESHLVDTLLSRGYQDLTVLDISSVPLEKARARLGDRAGHVKFLVSDITKFSPLRTYNLWHDRAAFHFLTTNEEVEAYVAIASRSLAPGGFLIVSTFSKTGPDECSGLRVAQYSDADLKQLFGRYFSNVRCFEDTHVTPRGTAQNFVYCGFVKQ